MKAIMLLGAASILGLLITTSSAQAQFVHQTSQRFVHSPGESRAANVSLRSYRVFPTRYYRYHAAPCYYERPIRYKKKRTAKRRTVIRRNYARPVQVNVSF